MLMSLTAAFAENDNEIENNENIIDTSLLTDENVLYKAIQEKNGFSLFGLGYRDNDEIIADYPFRNRVNELSVSEKQEITKTLTACADVMRFNIRNYNYDKLFKYVLYTHKNFQILTDIPADTGNSSNLGYNNVKLVNSDYIDYIMTRVFRITPEKTPVNELLERGFCYNDGYYYYIGGFGILSLNA